MDAAARARLETLYRLHAATVRAYALRRIDPAIADDVVSEVFVVAARRSGDVPDDALPWLLGCARRLIANQRRATARRSALLARITSTSRPPAGEPPETSGRLAAALGRLGDRDREVLMLVAWEGLEPDRAARVLGCSRSAFAMRLHRARRRLGAALTELPEPEEVC